MRPILSCTGSRPTCAGLPAYSALMKPRLTVQSEEAEWRVPCRQREGYRYDHDRDPLSAPGLLGQHCRRRLRGLRQTAAWPELAERSAGGGGCGRHRRRGGGDTRHVRNSERHPHGARHRHHPLAARRRLTVTAIATEYGPAEDADGTTGSARGPADLPAL